MLQQTQVKTVIPYFERWMRELPTVPALAAASSETIHKLWEGLGYYTRVRNMQKAAQTIVHQHGEKFPAHFDQVLALPGIGRYTAGAICSIAFNAPAPILDGNVIRVLTRLFAIRENVRAKETNERLWTLSESFVRTAANLRSQISDLKSSSCSALNQALMELGATVCTPREPRCSECPVARLCVARQKDMIARLPNLGPRPPSTARRFAAGVLERNGLVLVRQRPAGVVNGHLWEFPNLEVALKSSDAAVRQQLETELGCAPGSLTPLTTVKHTITRYRITLEAFHGRPNGERLNMNGCEWVALTRAHQLPFTSAHRRLLRCLAA